MVVDGSVTGKKRQKAFDQFLRHDATRLLIGNVKAAGVGWSAKGVSTVAFAELAWAPGTHTQAEDRIHGVGRGAKDRGAFAFYLVAKDTIEERLMELLQRKQKVLSAAIDGHRDAERFDVFDDLCKLLLKESKR